MKISGDGFTGVAVISVGNVVFYLTQANSTMQYDSLTISTLPDNGNYTITVALDDIPVTWLSSSNYSFASEFTPTVTSVSPTTASGPIDLTIVGTGFGNGANLPAYDIKVGNQSCQATTVNDNQIVCHLDGVDVGDQSVTVNIDGENYYLKHSNQLKKINLIYLNIRCWFGSNRF